MIKQWGGIVPQFYCDSCGTVTTYPGNMYISINRTDLVKAIDYTFSAIGEGNTLRIKPFIETLTYVIGKPPTIHKGALEENGYEINGEYIIRRKDNETN